MRFTKIEIGSWFVALVIIVVAVHFSGCSKTKIKRNEAKKCSSCEVVKKEKKPKKAMRSPCPVPPSPGQVCELRILVLERENTSLKKRMDRHMTTMSGLPVPPLPKRSSIPPPPSARSLLVPSKCTELPSLKLASSARMAFYKLEASERLSFIAKLREKYSSGIAKNGDLHYALGQLAKMMVSTDQVCLYKLRNAMWQLANSACTAYKGEIPDIMVILESKSLIKAIETKLKIPSSQSFADCGCTIEIKDAPSKNEGKLVCANGTPDDKIPSHLQTLISFPGNGTDI